eukprot:6465232-Amphidinium_carterae.1
MSACAAIVFFRRCASVEPRDSSSCGARINHSALVSKQVNTIGPQQPYLRGFSPQCPRRLSQPSSLAVVLLCTLLQVGLDCQ